MKGISDAQTRSSGSHKSAPLVLSGKMLGKHSSSAVPRYTKDRQMTDHHQPRLEYYFKPAELAERRKWIISVCETAVANLPSNQKGATIRCRFQAPPPNSNGLNRLNIKQSSNRVKIDFDDHLPNPSLVKVIIRHLPDKLIDGKWKPDYSTAPTIEQTFDLSDKDQLVEMIKLCKQHLTMDTAYSLDTHEMGDVSFDDHCEMRYGVIDEVLHLDDGWHITLVEPKQNPLPAVKVRLAVTRVRSYRPEKGSYLVYQDEHNAQVLSEQDFRRFFIQI